MSTFIAKYRGECEACHEPIHKGQEITGDAADGYVHADCDPDTRDDEKRKVVCSKCWLVKPCDCD
jgi:hypothetical protein